MFSIPSNFIAPSYLRFSHTFPVIACPTRGNACPGLQSHTILFVVMQVRFIFAGKETNKNERRYYPSSVTTCSQIRERYLQGLTI